MYNIITYEVIIPQEELIDCEYCGGDGIYVDGDNNTSKCTMCEKGKIPKEEPKQETLEEYIKEVTKNFGDEMSVKFTSGGIKLGAKWQADRMYSEEDMIESLDFSKSTNQEKSIYVARCLLNGKHIESKEILRIWKEQKPKLTTRMR
jgi:pyruvate carboxylase